MVHVQLFNFFKLLLIFEFFLRLRKMEFIGELIVFINFIFFCNLVKNQKYIQIQFQS